MKDKEESARARRLMRAKPKQCYVNAARVVLNVPEYAQADYVEGMAVIGGAMVIEHGWVEKDGVIIDPTLPHDDLDYFPGLRFEGQRGLAGGDAHSEARANIGGFSHLLPVSVGAASIARSSEQP